MGSTTCDETGDFHIQNETTKCNAESHLFFLHEIFPFFGHSFDNWCLCLIGDNCATNLKIASLCQKPYVGCCKYKLNLEVNKMIDEQASLKHCIDAIQNTLTDARKLKNAAILRNLTDLRPIVHNETR